MIQQNETAFDDGDGFGAFNSTGLSFKEIVMNHLRKISILSCVEFRGGFYEHKEANIPGAPGFDVYVEDTRAQYINAVNVFSDMLFAHFDTDMIKIYNDLETSRKKTYKDIFETGFYFTKQLGAKNKTIEDLEKENFVNSNIKRNCWIIEKLKNSRVLFRSLCVFLKRNSYLELGSVED